MGRRGWWDGGWGLLTGLMLAEGGDGEPGLFRAVRHGCALETRPVLVRGIIGR